MTYLSAEQVDVLLRPIKAHRVSKRKATNGTEMSYVEAHDIKAHLTRVFGFARWSSEVITQNVMRQAEVTMKNDKPGWNIVAHSIVKLTIYAPDGTYLCTHTEGHVGENTGPQYGDVLGNAITNSESYALKRCAIAMGSQFGLSLYNKGDMREIVAYTLVRPPQEGEPPTEDDLPETPTVREESEEVAAAMPEATAAQRSAPTTTDVPTAQQVADHLAAVAGQQGVKGTTVKIAAGKALVLAKQHNLWNTTVNWGTTTQPLGDAIELALSVKA